MYDGGGFTNVGRAYVYLYDDAGNWLLEHIFESPSQANNQRFGRTVKLSSDGSRAIICLGNSNLTGQSNVYYYSRTGTTWTLQQTITTTYNIGETTDAMDMSEDGSRIVLCNSTNFGRVQVFDYNSGTDNYELAVAQPTIPNNNDNIGESAALSNDGNILILSESGTNKIRVIEFDGTDWNDREILTNVNHSAPGRKALGVNEDGSIFTSAKNTVAPFNDFVVYEWDGTNYNVVYQYNRIGNVDLSTTNRDSSIVAIVEDTDSIAEISQGGDVNSLAIVQTVTAIDQPTNGVSNIGEMNYRGNMLVISNLGYDSQAGRILIYRV